MQPSEMRHRDDLAFPGLFNISGIWRVAIQGHVTSGFVVVDEVLLEKSMQMVFTEHDHVIQTLTTYRADHALSERVLPGRTAVAFWQVEASGVSEGMEIVVKTGPEES